MLRYSFLIKLSATVLLLCRVHRVGGALLGADVQLSSKTYNIVNIFKLNFKEESGL